MKATYILSSIVLLSAFCSAQVQAYALPKQPTKSYECDQCNKLSRDTLQDKWDISMAPLNSSVNNTQKSYSYKERVTLKQLKEGVEIATTAPGALIRITPLQKKPLPQLQIKTPTHQLMNLKEASALYAENESLGDILSTKNQTMMQINPELGSGTFILKSTAADLDNTDTYQISVLDKFSLMYVKIKTSAMHYQYGDTLVVTISLRDEDTNYSIKDIDASLLGPDGQKIPLKLIEMDNNQFKATTILDSEISDHGENWYIEANVETDLGDSKVKRSGHTVFSYAIPSASLLTLKKISSIPLVFEASLDVATGSRYSLQSVLFQQTDAGIIPVETSHKAQWLKPGKHIIKFTFDNSKHLSDDTLYLGYLRVLDYGQLKTVYQFDKPIKLTQLVD